MAQDVKANNKVYPMADGKADNSDSAKALEGSRSLKAMVTEVYEEVFTIEYAKDLLLWFMDQANVKFSISFDDIIMFMTFYVLFVDEVKVLAVKKSADYGVDVVSSICLFVFIFEMLASCWVKTRIRSWWPFTYDGYLFSFFFFLDIIAILSMFPDIAWIAEGLGIANVASSVSNTNQGLSKAGRVVRTVRLVRLVRLYKITAERRRQKKIMDENMKLLEEGVITYEEMQERSVGKKDMDMKQSKVGSELSDTTTRRVIVIVLAMLCLVPVLTYEPTDVSLEFATRTLHDLQVNQFSAEFKQEELDHFVRNYGRYYNTDYCILLKMQPFKPGYYLHNEHLIHSLRDRDIVRFRFSNGTAVTEAWFNEHWHDYNAAVGGILLTIFVSLVMVIGTVVFTADAQRLVLNPIERMMAMVEEVAKDPLKPMQFSHSEGSGEYETRLLETTIAKIAGLLRIGFGEAGARIISENLTAESGSGINPLIPGLRVYAFFGFCDIHHFEEVNEKLGKEIMSFVNNIAAVVHGKVNQWLGQINKNLGNAFLIVWRIGDEKSLLGALATGALTERQKSLTSKKSKDKDKGKDSSKEVDLRRVAGADTLADRALVAYLKIIAELNRNVNVLAYRADSRLTEEGTHDFKVRMGFGMHAGWAIEGAVGSLQKVDATYLSPHVNMAARLETSSKQYGVPLLVSERFYEVLSQPAKDKCRRLDVVTVKGSEVPIGIYTYDCVQDQIFPPTRSKTNKRLSVSAASVQPVTVMKSTDSAANKSSDALDAVTNDTAAANIELVEQAQVRKPTVIPTPDQKAPVFCTASDSVADIFDTDADLLALRAHVTKLFETTFQSAVELYIAGDWPAARPLFEKANQLMLEAAPSLKGDGPSKTLLKYMEAHGWNASSIDWKGFRPLTSK